MIVLGMFFSASSFRRFRIPLETETDRDRQRQTETDRDRQRQTEIMQNVQRVKATNEQTHLGTHSQLLHFLENDELEDATHLHLQQESVEGHTWHAHALCSGATPAKMQLAHPQANLHGVHRTNRCENSNTRQRKGTASSIES